MSARSSRPATQDVVALSDISLEVKPGRFVVLVGPSGCGKSTLLMMMAGLRQQTSGTILINDAPIPQPDPDRVGVVFQEASLFPWLTAEENVEFPLALRGVAKAERRAKAEDALKLVGLEGFGKRHPHELSGGMKQRVSIARGLVQDPPVLLMDEPFAALDEQTRMTMGDELLRIWAATGKTVVFVTHSLTEAVYLADEVMVMSARPGRIVDQLTIPLPRPRTYEMLSRRYVRNAARPHLAPYPQIGVRHGHVVDHAAPPDRHRPDRAVGGCCRAPGLIPELFLPSLSSTIAAGWNEAGEYGHALVVTLYEVAVSMVFACGGGILAGAIVGSLPRPRILIMPMISSLYAVPLVILYPVFTVWLGIGSESKIAFASIYGFLPTMLATAAGIQTIDPQLVLAARSMGATLEPAADPRHHSGRDPDRAVGPAGRRRAGHRRRRGVGDADLLGRHRLSDFALSHHPRQPACVRRRAPGAGDGDRLQRRDQMDRAQGLDLADRHPRRPARRRRHSCRRDPAGDLTESFQVFDLTLSFDNGPEPDVTPHVLDTLARARHQDHLLRDRRKTGRSRPPPSCGARP